MAELTRAGIRTGVLVAPLMPGINDAPEQVAPILELASEAGAAYVTGIALHLRGDVKGLFFEWLRSTVRIWSTVYKRLYQRGAYMPPEERQRLERTRQGAGADPAGRMREGSHTERGFRRIGRRQARGNTPWTPDQGRLF